MYTLPLPRWKYYEPQNFDKIQSDVTKLTNEIVQDLGWFPIRSEMALLSIMKLSAAASLLLGLLFNIIILLFIVISVLLIYSLLMISVETKTFETGVLRLIGMSKANCISMILVQSFLFVIPSIICGYLASIPMLKVVFAAMFKHDTGIHVSCIPTAFATVQALVLGFVIPIISSILPIQSMMEK